MVDHSSARAIDQLLANLWQEQQTVDLILRGCIELRWAIADEEREIARAIVYNAFEAYALRSGMPLPMAEQFCERHLDELIQSILAVL